MHRIFVAATVTIVLFAPLYASASPERISTISDRRSVNLTVYNGGTALVHDRRRVPLNAGVNHLAWRDVTANIDATSALLEPNDNNPIEVLEQNYDYDLLNPQALLAKYVGKYVTVVHDPRFAGERETRERAKVLSTNGGIVLQYSDRIETELRGHIAYPVNSKNFRDRPTLVFDLNSGRTGPRALDLSYLTSGLTWYAAYVATMSTDEQSLNLTGLVTLANTSGASFEDARLQLVAGNVNVAQPPPPMPSDTLRTIARVTSRAPGMENYLEYHLYTMPYATTIADNQTKQLLLLSARNIPLKKTLELRGAGYYYQGLQSDLGQRMPVSMFLTFKNEGSDLGVPLPAGIIRVYKNDSRGLPQFGGSDNIPHTPKGETVRLFLGNSFDVTARKRQTDYAIVNSCASKSSYEVVLSNAKTKPATVEVFEPIPGDWQILDESSPHIKTSSSSAEWTVEVPAAGKSILTYTAQTKWC